MAAVEGVLNREDVPIFVQAGLWPHDDHFYVTTLVVVHAEAVAESKMDGINVYFKHT